MSNELDAAKKFKTNIWRTSSARFWAARRLRRRSRLATFSIAIFATIAITLSIFQIQDEGAISQLVNHHLTFISIAISLFVLIISLLEGTGNYDVKAEHLHQNAVMLSELQKELAELIGRIEDGHAQEIKKVQPIRTRYNSLIRECPENHEPVDDDRFRADHRFSSEFKNKDDKLQINWFESIYIRFKYFIKTAWLYLLSWIIVGFLIIRLLTEVMS